MSDLQDAPPAPKTAPLAWLALTAALGLLIWHALVFAFVNDDAFISFRYADNLVRHGELVFNLGERVEGYTNFLWTLLMAGVLWLGQDPVPWSQALGIACGVGTLAVVARFVARSEGRFTAGQALAPLLLAASPSFACWSTGGLESMLFTLTVTWGMTAYLEERAGRGGRLPWSGVALALSAMTRPEGMLFFGLTGLHRLVELWVIERKPLPTRQDWLWGSAFGVLFGPYFAWRWLYYGWPFPNTYYVKTGAATAWKPGLNYLWSWMEVHFLWALPILVALRRTLPKGEDARLVSLVALYTAALSVHVVKVGGDFMALHRFLVPLLPGLAILAAAGVRALVSDALARGVSRVGLGVGAAALVAGLAFHVVRTDKAALKVGSEGGVDSIGWLSMFAGQCTAIGQWMGENAPKDASLATTAAGIIPYYSRLYTVDILGLNDEWIAHNVPAHGNRPGHTKSAPMSYLLEKQVTYLIYHPTIAERAPGQSAGQRQAMGARGYQWRTEQVPGLKPPFFGFWERTAP